MALPTARTPLTPPPDSATAAHQEAGPPPVGHHECKTELLNFSEDANIAECMEKLRKYEAAYARRLKAKYFSKKAFNRGDIFDYETTIDNEIIKSSRWPCMRSFADPIQTSEDQNGSPSSAAETSSTPTKKHPNKKSC